MGEPEIIEKPRQHKNSNWATILIILGVIFVGANLRAPLTAIGSLMPFIREDVAVSNALLGTITTVPLLAFAFLSPLTPKISQRFGIQKTILFSFILLSIGIVLRSVIGVPSLFIGTIIIGLAIAISNVLLPVFIKMSFPQGVGIMTGVYSVFMNLFGALSSGVSVPLAEGNPLSWRGALGAWAILSIIAALIWLPQLRKNHPSEKIEDAATQSKSIWKSPLAWKVTVFMGLQSLIFYTMMTWLPEILQSRGYETGPAGWMLSVMQFALIPFTFVIPIIADKMKNQKVLALFTAGFYIIGIGGFLLTNVFSVLWIILIGIATGSAFSLSMMFFTLRTKDETQAAELSGMAQSLGYTLAAFGPVLFGYLHDLTGGWNIPLAMLVIIAICIGISGFGAGKNETVKA